MQPFILVFLGGGLGSLCRYGISLLLAPFLLRFPWATLVSNGVACFLLGVFVALHSHGQIGDTRKLLLVTGFCGGFSTFSSFAFESLDQYNRDGLVMFFTNILLNLAICFLCVLLGLKITNYGN